MRLILALLMIAVPTVAAAEPIPLPRPRPAPMLSGLPPAAAVKEAAPATAVKEAAPTAPAAACLGRLTKEIAIASTLPPIESDGCEVPDVVRIEAIVLKDKSLVAVTPPATMGCTMAESLARWVRDDVTSIVREMGSPLRSIDNYASFNCRPRNNVAGAPVSEHGHANALDVRSVKLADGRSVKLFDSQVLRSFREGMKKSACARFTTVLGPGSDGYHEDHVHVDMMRRLGPRICNWAIKDAEPAAPVAAAVTSSPATTASVSGGGVPLPRPRPKETEVESFDARWLPH
ncbi:MAG TPA: extensin family protein [Xanthobacteraceae bacterium]|nr:extensin family protein [Xanthobacteraceae bacterium]